MISLQYLSNSFQNSSQNLIKILLVFIIFLSSKVFAVVPPSYSVNQLYPDVKFIGAVTIKSAMVHFDSANEVCGINYKATITHSAYGDNVGNQINLHLLKDIRENQNLEPFEVGSNYFIYAENKETHRFLRLTDVVYKFPEYTDSCHANDKESLYVYRELSGKVLTEDGINFVDSRGLRLVTELSNLKSAYYSEKLFRTIEGTKSPEEMYDEKLYFQGYILNELIEYLRNEMKSAMDDIHSLLWDGNVEPALNIIQKKPELINSVDGDGRTPLHIAARFEQSGSGKWAGKSYVVKWLLDRGAKVNVKAYNDFTPLHLAENGQTAKELLDAGADVNAIAVFGDTPLQYAAQTDRHDVVDVILAAGVTLDLRSALILKRYSDAKEIILKDNQILSTKSKGISLWGNNRPLGIVAAQGDVEMVKFLLDHGARVDEGTAMPNARFSVATPLFNAVGNGHVEVVKVLLENGANPKISSGGKFHNTLIEYAEEYADEEIVALLKQYEKNFPTEQE